MSRFNTADLLKELEAVVLLTIKKTEGLHDLDKSTILKQPAPDKWSVVQVLEHLNAYNRYYLKEISKVISNKSKPKLVYKGGWFGDYFTKMMQPRAEGLIKNKMKAPKDYWFDPQLDAEKVLSDFIAGQRQLLEYLDKSNGLNIGQTRVPISISKFIKLKLGDTFRFLIAHQQRHFIQIENTLTQIRDKELIS